MTNVDLNCDLGECLDAVSIGADSEIITQVTSINVACGFHAGNHSVMHEIVRAAKHAGVAVGAHPGFPDMPGFGRRNMDMPPDELRSCILYQIGALYAILKAEGMSFQHVKPHGALYNMAAEDLEIALVIGKAIQLFDSSLIYCGLAGSQMTKAAETLDLRFSSEVFADRAYQPDGTLLPRSQPGAVIEDANEAADRVLCMVKEGWVSAADGSKVLIKADTVCIHGDNPMAGFVAMRIKTVLEAEGIALVPMAEVAR